jgi:DNA-binding transcriptional ArsR family regulator
MRAFGPTLWILTVLLVVGAAPALVAGASAAPAPAATVVVSASATPSYGAGPLLVQFETTLGGGTPTAYNWSFGDGTYLNGTTAATSDPSHLYERPGTYSAAVVVHEGANAGTATVPVHVLAAVLAVSVSAAPATGVAPLTVLFQGSVRGGTGTYVALNWTFGDGASGTGSSIEYTYESPGHYYTELIVEDSNGSDASGGVWVNVSAADAPATTGLTSLGALGWSLVGFAVGLGIAVVLFPVRSWLGRREDDEALTAPAPPVSRPTAEPESLVTPTDVPESVPAPDAPGPPGEALRTSQRLLVHLATQGTLGPYDVAPAGMTQAGIGTAIGVRQNALTNVLRRLADAGLIEADVRHVQGQPRRLKVYRLTPRGQILARELRQRRPPRADE